MIGPPGAVVGHSQVLFVTRFIQDNARLVAKVSYRNVLGRLTP